MTAKPRTIRQVLAHPQTDAEEIRADRHIRQAAARIRAAWSDEETRKRAGLPRRPERVTCPTVETDFPER